MVGRLIPELGKKCKAPRNSACIFLRLGSVALHLPFWAVTKEVAAVSCTVGYISWPVQIPVTDLESFVRLRDCYISWNW